MAHKLFKARVVQHFRKHDDSTWVTLPDTCIAEKRGDDAAISKKRRLPTEDPNILKSSISGSATVHPDCLATVLYTQRLTGVSQARRGYVLMLLSLPSKDYPKALRRINQLSPLARQNISFVSRITHEVTCRMGRATSPAADGSDSNRFPVVGDEAALAVHLWNELVRNKFDAKTSVLRADFHPKDLLPSHVVQNISWQLERLAFHSIASSDASGGATKPTNAFEVKEPFTDDSPIDWTKTRSKCTHQLTVIFIHRRGGDLNVDALIDSYDCYFGVDTRGDCSDVIGAPVNGASLSAPVPIPALLSHALIDLPLNHQAAQEIIVVPCHPTTGEELPEHHEALQKRLASIDGTVAAAARVIPLSRAYYKLRQVCQDHMTPDRVERWNLCRGSGLDLGACPGGWTQALVELGLSRVVAVDPGCVGRRVAALPHVTHVRSSMEDAGASGALAPHGPYALVVCDASLMWTDLWELLVQKIAPSAEWLAPCVWVVTLKFPFKTLGSIRNHVELVRERLPRFLGELSRALYPTQADRIQVSHKLLHLMANADSERTLLAVFEPKSEGAA